MLTKIFLLVFYCGFCCISFGQTSKISQLKKELRIASTEAQKLAIIFKLCEERSSLPTDTLFYYASLAKQIATKHKNDKEMMLADYYLANSLVKKGLLDSSMQIVNKHLPKLFTITEEAYDLLNKYTYLKGQLLIKAARHKEAIELYYQSLVRAEKNGDTLAQIISKNCIGWAYMEMDQNQEAISWFYKAIATTGNRAWFEKYSIPFSNMAATYNAIGKNDSAEHFINQSLYYSRKQQNLQAVANTLAIQADIFIDTKRSDLAEIPLNEVVEIRRQIGDPFYIVSDMMQLAVYYAHNNQPAKGIALCEEGIKMANQFNLTSKLAILYDALANNYKAAGNFELYAATLRKLIAVKDSVYKQNSETALAEMQAKYNVQKKETIIVTQQLDLVRKNYWLYGSLILFLIIAMGAYLLFRSYRKKQQLRLRLMQEEEKRKSERAVLSAGETERKRIAADLHDSLGAYAASIASNIDYLQQRPGAASKAILQELRSNAQSMVAQLSDSIWVLKKNALLLTAISDRLKLFIQKIAPSYPEVTIDVVEDVATDHLLPPSQAFHLFQIVKEAVNNALRHSRCRQIIVSIEGNDDWQLKISDDGRGFMQSTTLAEGGNGVLNMKARAKESGWKIEWRANQPQGTSVVIEPTTN